MFDQCVLSLFINIPETKQLTLKLAKKLLGIWLFDKKSNAWVWTQIELRDVNLLVLRSDNRWTKRFLIGGTRDTTRRQGRPPTRWTKYIKRHVGNGKFRKDGWLKKYFKKILENLTHVVKDLQYIIARFGFRLVVTNLVQSILSSEFCGLQLSH